MWCKTPTFSTQYIEHKISTIKGLFKQMIEQKNLSDSLKKVVKPFNNGLGTMF